MFPKIRPEQWFLFSFILSLSLFVSACSSAAKWEGGVSIKADQGIDKSQDTVVNLVEKSNAAGMSW